MGTEEHSEWHLWSPAPPGVVLQSMDTFLRASSDQMCGIVGADRLELHHPTARKSLRAPQLVVDVAEERGGTKLSGRFSQHPHVWAATLGTGAVAAFAALVSVSYAYAQWVMQQPMTALLPLAASLVLGLLVLVATRLGGHHATPQAQELKEFLERGLPADQEM